MNVGPQIHASIQVPTLIFRDIPGSGIASSRKFMLKFLRNGEVLLSVMLIFSYCDTEGTGCF